MKNWIQITRWQRPEAIIETIYGEVEWCHWLRHEAARIAPCYVETEIRTSSADGRMALMGLPTDDLMRELHAASVESSR